MFHSLPKNSGQRNIIIISLTSLLITLFLFNSLFYSPNNRQKIPLASAPNAPSFTKHAVSNHYTNIDSANYASNTSTHRQPSPPPPIQPKRKTQSQPNPLLPISYPSLPTGTLNLTLSILPIPLALARSMIPTPYPILTSTYLSMLPPSWPPSSYPLLVETRFDHDIQYDGVNVLSDFQSFVWLFPFVGRLGEGGGSFVFGGKNLISKGVEMAIEGARAYGEVVGEAVFSPALEGYGAVRGAGNGEKEVRVWLDDKNGTEQQVVEVRFIDDTDETEWKDPEGGIYGIEFFKNITNQPFFSLNKSICDNQIILYNTSLSTGPNAPVPIQSDIWVSDAWFPGGLGGVGWGDVGGGKTRGIRVDTAFVERNDLDCEGLRNYVLE